VLDGDCVGAGTAGVFLDAFEGVPELFEAEGEGHGAGF